MKQLKRLAVLLLSTFVIIFGSSSLESFAADINNLDLTISTDKPSYSGGETVKLKIDVKNNNSFTIDNLELTGTLPKEFTFLENKSYSMKLEPSESKSYTISAKASNTESKQIMDSPKTGVGTPIVSMIIFAGAASFIVFSLVKNKKARKMLAVVLCITSVSAFIGNTDPFIANAKGDKITISKSISFNYNKKSITAEITAEYEDMNIISINTEPLGEADGAGCYNIDKIITTLEGSLKNSSDINKFSYEITDMKNVVVSNGEIPIGKEWAISNLGLVVGGNNITLTAVSTDKKIYTSKIIVFNMNMENMKNTNVDLSDNDGDKLPAYFEEWFGTDPKKMDTDDDGLSDYDEIYIYNTDPVKADSNDNGINDIDEDFDEDGLTLKEEIKFDTDPFNADTDNDGLKDGDEVNKYNTDPLVADTDSDGLKDGEETELNTDPLKEDTDENGITDNEESTIQTIGIELENSPITYASVSLSVPGNIKNHVKVRNTEYEDILSTDVVGRIGAPVEFESDVDFETADITFTYDESLLGDTPIENLAIMWYDEENMMYRIFDRESVIDTEAKTITYTTTHFSTYLVVDRQIWYDTWREPINYRDGEVQVETKYDISFVVDVSGSMSGSSIERAKLAMNSFIDAMFPQDMASIVTFNHNSSLQSHATSDREALRSTVNSLISSGGTDTNAGLNLGIDQIVNDGRADSKHMIIMICDGDVNYIQSTIDRAKDAGISVYTINVINGDNTYLQKIADETGGEYYYAATTEDIIEKMDNVRNDTLGQVDMTDTDGDGLYDVYETKGMRIQNGRVITTNPFLADSDGDSVSDRYEFYNPNGINNALPFEPGYFDMDFVIGKYSCVVFRAASDPNKADSDGDSVLDKDDLNPYIAARHSIATTEKSTYKKIDNRVTNFDFMQSFEERLRAENDATYATLSDQVDFSSYAAKSYAYLVVAGGAATIILEENAAWALSWFLANSGLDKEFNAASMLSFANTNNGFNKIEEQVNRIYEFAKDVLYDGQSITIGSASSFISYEDNILGLNAINWTATLGTASGGASATIKRNGDRYTVYLDYTIFDYYDWDISDDRTFIPGLPNASLALMHYEGIARAYYQYGTYRDIWFF